MEIKSQISFLLVECEQLIREHAQRAPASPHSACGFGTAAVACRVPRVIALLSNACVVLPDMTTAPCKSSTTCRQRAQSMDISETLARVRNLRDDFVIPNPLFLSS